MSQNIYPRYTHNTRMGYIKTGVLRQMQHKCMWKLTYYLVIFAASMFNFLHVFRL